MGRFRRLLAVLAATWLIAASSGSSAAAADASAANIPAAGASAPGAPSAGDGADGQFFENRIRPLLVEQCYSCHSADAKKLKGQLLLDSRDGLLKGGDSGAAMVAGHPEQSRLIEAVQYANHDLQMPPKQKLSDQQIADLSHWVERGAVWPGASAQPSAPARPGFDLQKRKASHWAWQPISDQQPPAVQDASWAKTPIDRFILAKLEGAHLTPAPAADRRTLIRRVYFDIVGLPPTPAQAQAFVDDASPQAFEKVVDELLASPHFGERWARHWLDLVRYGETRGHEFDPAIPNAWQYRDYVTRAFNSDVPYNQFATEQIAGDLLDRPRLGADQQANESILGTGFWFLGEEVHSPVNIRQDEADRMNNRLDALTKTFMGLTVGCARCHDHKFDAISTKDYYALTGILISSAYRQVPFESLEPNRRVATQVQQLVASSRPALLKLAADAARPGVARTSDYLLGARDALLQTGVRSIVDAATDRGDRADASLPLDVQHTINDVAQRRQLDATTLKRWVMAVGKAMREPTDPLYAFADVGLDPHADQPAHLAQELRDHVNNWNNADTLTRTARASEHLLVDYCGTNPGWWADGFEFGLAPTRAGDLELPAKAAQGISVYGFGAARRDMAWPDTVTQGETDYGALGSFARSGRTFRTRKVTLPSGHVWFRARGAARVYAAVASHLIIGGPLHGQLLMEVGKDDNRWRWVHQDLTNYAGQRVQFEITPVGAGSLEVAQIVDSAQSPASEDNRPGELVRQTLADKSIQSIEQLATTLQNLLSSACDDLATDRIVGCDNAVSRAPAADWLLRHADLFSNPNAPLRAQLDKAVDQAIAARAQLLAQVKRTSQVAPAMLDGNGVDENVLVRGVAANTGPLVPRRFLEALATSSPEPYPTQSSGRLRLAQDMFADTDPFPARVMVNRVWEKLFGIGIVATLDNFGVLGEAPTHRELLDYLAQTFSTRQHWSVKQLIRSIVLSNAYQMSSRIDSAGAGAEQADPRNILLHRMNVRRLQSEAIRDEILAVSGRLDGRIGGPSIEVHLTQFMTGRGEPSSGPLDGAGRRSIYIKVRRNFLSPMMLAYDTPIPAASVGRRSNSNVPAQALILMNDPFVVQQAGVWAEHLLATPASADERIVAMYEQAFARPPTDDEKSAARDFLDQQGAAYGLPTNERLVDRRVWSDLAHVLFNVKEFIFIR